MVVSILYKYSFVSVDAVGTIAIKRTSEYNEEGQETNSDYTPIGASDIHSTDNNHKLVTLSSNLVDYITGGNGSVVFLANDSSFDTNVRTNMILGPKVNATYLTEVINGTVQSCDALFYMRSTFYSWTPLCTVITQTPYSDGVRMGAYGYNQTDPNNSDGVLDITSLDNGTLQAWAGSALAFCLDWALQLGYADAIDVNMEYC